MIVKEKLRGKNDQQPRGLGVMIKQPKGFDAKSGDWQFLFVDEQNKLTTTRSKLTGCVDCHSKQSDSDYVFGTASPDKSNAAGY